MDASGSVALVACGLTFVAVVVVSAVFAIRRERRRVEALRTWAQANSWRVVDSPPADWTSRMPGRNRRGVSMALVGVQQGHQVSVAEYRHTVSSSSTNSQGQTTTSRRTHHYVVVVVHLEVPGAFIEVRHRGGLSKLGRTLFGDRATALGEEQFDSQWRVTAEDPRVVPGFIGPLLAAEHIAGRVPSWSFQGHELITYQPGRLTEPDRIPELVAPLLRVASLLGR